MERLSKGDTREMLVKRVLFEQRLEGGGKEMWFVKSDGSIAGIFAPPLY
jgi:hypothetical protein